MTDPHQRVHDGDPAHSETDRHTVADLVAFINQMRDVPGYTEKSITDIRLGARMVLHQLA